MLKAIHASEDVVAAGEKAIGVIAKLRRLRLTKAAELAEAGVEGDPDLPRLPGGAAWSSKRYLNIRLLKKQQMRGAIAA